MNDTEQKRIFAGNLSAIMQERNLKQNEVAKAIGVSPQTFNTWMQGKNIPRMDKIQKLANYFGCLKSDLVDDKIGKEYLNIMVETVYNRIEMHKLMDAASKLSPDEVNKIIKMIEVMYGKTKED